MYEFDLVASKVSVLTTEPLTLSHYKSICYEATQLSTCVSISHVINMIKVWLGILLFLIILYRQNAQLYSGTGLFVKLFLTLFMSR